MDYSWNDDALSMIKLINLLICNLLSSINHSCSELIAKNLQFDQEFFVVNYLANKTGY